ncbi:hypothetical protein DTO006G1_5691 [Penicillium roqueforti]|uniref:uncharacterized protein n=1 Tax=Penicillium roqueforti TaxID=5082 RepID=UPI00190D6580|nr:uncharacterized protein LCP9604111_6072 [Penicillium roqueforti]KAF9247882.1 hypothetical protein LCP9604111_6072 [Penicillium roqueforti]KAI2686667.1 hypothetical protein LCP963914a_4267 [Penicillium roqueforti]KAI2715962.1 hypothetical protein CBS147318_5813 [Penicillium roqueforti]KAI2759278.1 hypothetical protein DTO006G1_5691 [Penicillium roqueforti]KAI2774765.1 hypothetical protein DTO012A8_951 [Penicillium roqueforti]
MSNPGYPSAWKPGKPPRSVVRHRRGPPLFNTLTATAYDLQQMMIAGTLKSTDLVEEYVRNIEEHNGYLRAVSVYAPVALERAQELDAKREAGEFLGPLHGIPVFIKWAKPGDEDIHRSSGAPEYKIHQKCAGCRQAACCWSGYFGKDNHIKEKVSHAVGLQLTAKDSPYIPGGFDPTDSIGGHTVPGGSSSGVSIVISAGLAANGVGTDTDASITAPAVRASLYLIRPTTGIVSVNGTVPCPKTFDTIGPMGRSVRDVADLLTALVEPGKTKTPQGGYASSATKNHGKSFRIGTLDPEVWNYPDFLVNPVPEATERINRIILETYSKIREGLASVFHENADLPPVSEFMLNGKHSIYTSWISNELMFSTTTSASCQDLP